MENFHILERQAGSLVQLGGLIRQRRKANGLRIDDAAALCGVSVGSLSRLETGSAAVGADKLIQVLDRLGLTLLVVEKEHLTSILSAEMRSEP